MQNGDHLRANLIQAQGVPGVLRGLGTIFVTVGALSGVLLVWSGISASNGTILILYMAMALSSLLVGTFFWAVCAGLAAVVDGVLYKASFLDEPVRGAQVQRRAVPLGRK